MKLIKHKLYSYLTLTDTLASSRVAMADRRKNPKAKIKIRIKQGLTIKQEIDVRAEQQDNASNTSDIIVINRMEVEAPLDVKLDDKIRDIQHQQPLFQEFKRLGHISKKHEWSLMDITDILEKTDLTETFLYGTEEELHSILTTNKDFLSLIDETIFKSKNLATKKILGTEAKVNVVLRPWQQYVFDLLIASPHNYWLLSLAPRFGKTLLLLELAKFYQSKGIKIVLVPASKSLSSNESFIEDYKEYGYDFKIIDDASLFVDGVKIIETLKSQIESDEVLLLVTDEADVASHTTISIDKLDNIKDNFNVHKVVAMTGTAIYKASKIFLGVKQSDIEEINITYTDLFDFKGIGCEQLVKRNFLDIYYPIEQMPDGLNIMQSFEQSSARAIMSEFIKSFVNDTPREEFYGLHQSDVTMCFVPGLKKNHATSFKAQFDLMFSDIIRIEIINGDTTTNRKAQKKVKKMIDTMKKDGDTRKLLLFSRGMSQRSFSIPNIRRVIILSDGLISSSFLQMAARCLTYDSSKSKEEQIGDIIRISTSNINLMAELFMQERPEIKHGKGEAEKYGKKFLTNNTFSSYECSVNDANALVTLNVSNSEQMVHEIAKLLDAATKITDSVKYLVGRFFYSGLNYSSVTPDSMAKASKKTVDDKSENKPKGKTPAKASATAKEKAQEEKNLERYIAITRCMPYIGRVLGKDFNTLNELLSADWSFFNSEVGFYKEDFKDNLLDQDFKTHVESLFRSKAQLTEDELNDRAFDIIKLIGA